MISIVGVATKNGGRIRTCRLASTIHRTTNRNLFGRHNSMNHSGHGGDFAFAIRQLQTGRLGANQGSSRSSRMKLSSKGRKRSKPTSRKQQQQQQLVQQRRQKATLASSSSGARQSKQEEILFRTLRERTNLWLNEPRKFPVPRWVNPELVTFRYSECFGHLSFFLVAVSYAVDDFLHLRLIAIAGSSAMLVFTYFHPHGRVLWLPFRWNCIFVALNSWRVAKVAWDHYWTSQLPSNINALYEDHFGDTMEKTDFARLFRLGTVETLTAGETVVSQGSESRYVRLVVSGDLEVDRDGQTTYWLREGQFMSEMGLHAGLGLRGSVTSCCSVKAQKDVCVLIRWDRTELMHLLDLHKSMYRSLRAFVSWDIVSKLKSQRVLLASGKIDDPERWTKKRREQSLARYSAILRNMLAHPKYLNQRKDKLARYREIHQVGESDHEAALRSIGWTVEEFEAGYKEGQLDEDALEVQNLGYKWWLSSWWKAL